MTRSFVTCWIAVATLGLACGDGDGDGTIRPPSEQTPVTPKADPQPSDPQSPPPSDVPKSDAGAVPSQPPATGPAPSCDASLEKNACGGALTGTYIYKEACASPEVASLLTGVCPGLTVSNIQALSRGGTLSFAGLSYSLKVSTDVSYDVAVPAACAAIGCQAVQMAASSALSKSASSVKVSCSGAIGCTCSVSYTMNLSRSGALMTSGGVATLAGGGQYWYCVKPGGLLYKGMADTADVGIAYALGR